MSSSTILGFESELKNKIQFKASSKISNDAVLFKAFKFFDLYNHGSLPKADFFKAIAKCGVVPDTHNLNEIFEHYDPQNSGKIDYRTFIENLLFKDESESGESLNRSHVSERKSEKEHDGFDNYNEKKSEKVSQASHNSPSNKLNESGYRKEAETVGEISEVILNELRGEGISGLLNFANQLKSTDFEKTHLINLDGLSQYLRYLSPKSINTLISEYNPNKFGEINYAELIYGLKRNMNLQRQALIDDLFNMLDEDQKGEIEINKIIGSYRNRSEIGSLKRAIDLYCRFQSIDDGIFTDEDFNDFFEFISFAFGVDASFQEFIKIGFYSEEPPRSTTSNRSKREFEVEKDQSVNRQFKPYEASETNFKKNKAELSQNHEQQSSPRDELKYDHDEKQSQVSNQSRRSEAKSQAQQHQVEIPEVKEINMILLRMKRTLASKGTRGFLQFEKLLKLNDSDQDGRVNIDQFKNVIKEQKIDITSLETMQVFAIFDTHKNGLLNFQEIIQTLKGEVPPNRQNIISRLWNKVKIDEDHTTFSKIRSTLNFKNHPDIQTGRKVDDQIWNEIQETILMIQDLNGSARSDTIYKEIFEEYCENLSLSVSEDQLLDSIVQNFWKIGSYTKIEDEYAGSRKVFDPKKSAYLQDHHKYAYNGVSVSQSAPFGTFDLPTNYGTEHRRL